MGWHRFFRIGQQELAVTFVLARVLGDAGPCLLDNHRVLFQTQNRKWLFTNIKLSGELRCTSGWHFIWREADPILCSDVGCSG